MQPTCLATLFLCLALRANMVESSLWGVLGRIGKHHAEKTVHVIFNNHLDIGFDGIWPELGYDNNVINRYFNVYFPLAISLAEEYHTTFKHERFVFTTHAYLISLYLDCPPGMGLDCPAPPALKETVRAIRKGYITWHAYPFNGQLELSDPSLIEFGVQLVHELDKQFGQPIKTTLSQRDVPGLTRAALPILVKSGIKAISVGVNKGSAPPDVPRNTVFIWKDPASGAQVFATWHPGGYGGINASDCVQVPGFHHVLCLAWRGDNGGPPKNVSSINQTLSFIREQFPGAAVRASTFEDYLFHLEMAANRLDLPVVTGEIGDTWINGVQSDPLKVSDYRTALRLRTRCLKEGACSVKDPAFHNFSRILLKVHEHTWGVDIKQTLHDTTNWTNAALQAALREQRTNYADCVKSWIRQAQYIKWAEEALPRGHPLAQMFQEERAAQERNAPHSSLQRLLKHARRHSLANRVLRFKSQTWVVEVDSQTGSFTRLQRLWSDSTAGVNWAGGNDSSFARLLYSTYDEASFDVIWNTYMYLPRPAPYWFEEDLGKVNCSLAQPKRADTHPRLTEALSAVDPASGSLVILLHYTFPDWAVRDAGAPASMWTLVHMHDSQQQHPAPHAEPGELHIDVVWLNKTATRLPEALWLQFQLGSGAVDADSWTMNKLGQHIKPSEVVPNGSFSLHAVQDEALSVHSLDGSEQLLIGSLDTSLVSAGQPNPFPNIVKRPDMSKGMSFNMVNNIWGTNYVMWVPYTERDVNMKFRFFLRAKRKQPAW